MAQPDSFPKYHIEDSPPDNIFRYFEEQQAADPTYMETLAQKLWDNLAPPQRELRMIVQAVFFPHDLKARAQSAKANLLIEYAINEAAITQGLQELLDTPSVCRDDENN